MRVMAAFAVAFVAAATAVFALSALAGAGVRQLAVPLHWRAVAAAVCLFALALLDVISLRRKRYCLLGMARQAKKSLLRKHGVTAVAAAWGADTGLVVTTFRVAALTWGAMILGLLGFASWWSGLAYGLAFTIPLLALLSTKTNGHRLERLLRRRALIQSLSALLLVAAGTLFLSHSLA